MDSQSFDTETFIQALDGRLRSAIIKQAGVEKKDPFTLCLQLLRQGMTKRRLTGIKPAEKVAGCQVNERPGKNSSGDTCPAI